MTPDALVLAPIGLAAVLVLSGIAKLRDRESTLSVVTELRLPGFLRHDYFAWLLPWSEIVLAVLLLSPWQGAFTIAAILSLGLFVAYWAVIARALTFDPRPNCGCFGRIGDQNVSVKTLVRNSVLVLLGALTLWLALSGSTVPAVIGRDFMVLWWIADVALLVALTVLIVTRPGPDQPGPAPLAASGSTGADASDPEDDDYARDPIPAALLQSEDGGVQTLRELASAKAQLLVAFNCVCKPSHVAAGKVAEWSERLPEVDVRILSTVPHKPLRRSIPTAEGVLYDHESLAWRALGLTSSPSAVLLGADGYLAGGPVEGLDEMESFVEEIAEVLREAAEQR
ncbi:MauE/DoxX family redox-associated membrane protein [Arthrobacter sp. Y-9]|uniref:MauE/DoxX family redox-associated membrane protein n=1 Tax=Arthrobacter sp. Y-9 TaxID=3039385 RepID=UPI00241E0568|nr:MauE/DoxX family redox-associated membrane protein [Arthrobacter sp. Y-9]WFR84713.1 MauE/DoxX family redox-associated membrane protein [Arthrobacter sp. Y-9]